jgi:hypothetical protein
VLALNPEDEEASKNAKILNKWITEGKGTNWAPCNSVTLFLSKYFN